MQSFSEEGQSRIIELQDQINGEEKEERRIAPSNLAKLGYQQIFYQKDNQIVVEELGTSEKPFSLKYFHSAKEIHEKGIKKFKSQYCAHESESVKPRRRGYSIDTESTGAYYLNNWMSHQQFLCEKPAPEQKTANLVYEILAMRWNKAIEITASLPRTTQTATLEYILNGFKAISSLLTEEEKFFSEHFLGRNTHDITIKLSSESVGGYFNFLNVFEEEARVKFLDIRGIPRKVEILRVNLDYLIKFAGSYKPTTDDNYLQLAFKILGNNLDQEQSIQSQNHDYLKILLNLDLKISDRLNFATKLLGDKKRREFCLELQEKLCHFSRLENILYYISPPLSKQKEERIQLICKCYLDKYLDLEIIAYLAHEFPFLRKYYIQFQQALQMSCEHKELERLENYKWSSEKESFKDYENRKPVKKITSFFSYVNIPEQRITDWKISPEHFSVCQICCKKMLKTETLLECGKCRHGGHINHLTKWFQEYENCPHIGCPCLCN